MVAPTLILSCSKFMSFLIPRRFLVVGLETPVSVLKQTNKQTK